MAVLLAALSNFLQLHHQKSYRPKYFHQIDSEYVRAILSWYHSIFLRAWAVKHLNNGCASGSPVKLFTAASSEILQTQIFPSNWFRVCESHFIMISLNILKSLGCFNFLLGWCWCCWYKEKNPAHCLDTASVIFGDCFPARMLMDDSEHDSKPSDTELRGVESLKLDIFGDMVD